MSDDTQKPSLFARIKEMLTREDSTAEDNHAEAFQAVSEEVSALSEDFSQQLAGKASAGDLQQLREEFDALVKILDEQEKPDPYRRDPATGEDFSLNQRNLANC